VAKVFAAARLPADQQARIMAIVVPAAGPDIALGRSEFNVLLALIGLAQEGEVVSLDGVDERRKSELLPVPFSPAVVRPRAQPRAAWKLDGSLGGARRARGARGACSCDVYWLSARLIIDDHNFERGALPCS
jgi:hypothetical protein